MMEAQRGARLKYPVTQLCFSADGRGPEVTERLETREGETDSRLMTANLGTIGGTPLVLQRDDRRGDGEQVKVGPGRRRRGRTPDQQTALVVADEETPSKQAAVRRRRDTLSL